MTRSKRIRPVVELAENRHLDAARSLGLSRKQLEHQEMRLHELISYRQEYSRRYSESCGGGIGAMRLNEYRIFLARLDQAIRQQQTQVEQARRDCDQKRQQWLASRTRAKALDKVMDRYRREELEDAERREQKEQDERALHRSRRS